MSKQLKVRLHDHTHPNARILSGFNFLSLVHDVSDTVNFYVIALLCQ